jgi:DNA-binding SARP family transcriptional activator
VDISVLGPLEVRRGTAAVRLGAPKLRVLLLSLVLDLGRPVHAERLIEHLWGGDPPPQPLVSLRSYVSNLRRLLQDPESAPVIDTRTGGYVLTVSEERVDAYRFERLARRGRGLVTAGDPAEGLEVLTDALALWRGPAFADIADEPHARPTIVKLEELRLTATEDRFDALLATGRHVEALPELEAFVGQQPSRERVLRQLVLALYRSGRAPDALRTAADHRTVLVEEYGLDPSPQLAQLTERILRQDPSLDPPDPAAPPAGPGLDRGIGDDRGIGGARATGGERATAEASALVGRARERRAIEVVLDGLAQGCGASLLLAGEPGIGKTALLEELSRRARERGVPVAWGRCLEHAGAPPFWPWLEVLRVATDHLDDDGLRDVLAGNGALVTQLVPDLATRAGTEVATAPGDPDTARFALYDAVATVLTRIAADRGLVVVVDDLHWADRSSLQLLALLATRAAAGRVLLAAAHRDAATDRTPELEAALAAAVREPVTTTLTLPPLAGDEVAALVERTVGSEPPADVVTTVQHRAGGNPFFVHQLAALLVATDGGRDASGGDDDIPVGVRHVLLQRMDPLPHEVRRTLAAAAVLGQEFELRPLAAATDVDVPAALDHLDVAIRHGLVEVAGGHAAAYRFVHALVRETITHELTPGAAARLHAAAATALEQVDPAPVEAIADHLWHAADLVDQDRVVGHLRAAADEAVAVLAFEQAERQLRRALVVLERVPAADPSVELGVRLRLVQVLTSLYGWAAVEREEVTARVRKLAGRAGIGADLVPLWWSLWSTMMTRGDLGASQELAAELLAEAVRSDDPASLVAGHVATAYTDLFAGAATEDVLARLEVAAEAERRADPASLARTPEHLGLSRLVNLTMAHALAGDVEPALEAGAAAVRYAQGAAGDFQEGYARMFAAWAAALVDRPEAARTQASSGLELCEHGGYGSIRSLIEPVHAWAAARCGEVPQEQAARMAPVLEALIASGHLHALGHWFGLLAEVQVLAGDDAGARSSLRRADELAAATGERAYGRAIARVRDLVEDATGG